MVKGLKVQFEDEGIQRNGKHTKQFSAMLVITEIQPKTTMG